MPLLSTFFLIFTLGNISFPGTSNFVGEFLIMLGLVKENLLSTFFCSFGIILGAIYAMWLYNRVFFYKLKVTSLLKYNDINRREFIILIPFLFFLFFLGIFPDSIIRYIETYTSFLNFYLNYNVLDYKNSFANSELSVAVDSNFQKYKNLLKDKDYISYLMLKLTHKHGSLDLCMEMYQDYPQLLTKAADGG